MIIKGIDNKLVNKVSKYFKEDIYFNKLRNNSLELFNESSKPIYGPDMKIDYNDYIYLDDDKKVVEYKDINKRIKNNINKYNLPKDNIIIQSNYHDIYTKLNNNIICTNYNDAYKNYNKIFTQYYNKIIKFDENIFTLLSNTMFNNTLFIYIPPYTKSNNILSKIVDIDSNSAVINRILIVVDEYSSFEFINNITSSKKVKDSLFLQNIEIIVKKHSSCKFINIQDLSNKVYNVSIKRAQLDSYSSMEWVEVNSGSLATMSYPTSLIYGSHARSKIINITCSDNTQLDTGGRILHQASNSKSDIINYSFVNKKGMINNRSTVRISTASINSIAKVKSIVYLFDTNSTYNMIPRDILRNNTSSIEHSTIFKKTTKKYDLIIEDIIKKYTKVK